MEKKYNVYAWNYKHSKEAMLVASGVDISTANKVVVTYLSKGLDWDAYAVPEDEDPGL